MPYDPKCPNCGHPGPIIGQCPGCTPPDSASNPILKEIQDAPVGYKNPPREGQWKPGQSGNPGGRPKWKPVSEALQHLVTPDVAEAIASQMLIRAGKGDVSAFNAVMDRLEGKVPNTIGGSTEVGPLKLVVGWEK